MKADHGFDATKAEYETQFRKHKFRKYMTGEDWKYVRHRMRARKEEDRQGITLFNGEAVPDHKVRRELDRRFPHNEYIQGKFRMKIVDALSDSIIEENPPSPEGIMVLTPRLASNKMTGILRINNLPCQELEFSKMIDGYLGIYRISQTPNLDLGARNLLVDVLDFITNLGPLFLSTGALYVDENILPSNDSYIFHALCRDSTMNGSLEYIHQCQNEDILKIAERVFQLSAFLISNDLADFEGGEEFFFFSFIFTKLPLNVLRSFFSAESSQLRAIAEKILAWAVELQDRAIVEMALMAGASTEAQFLSPGKWAEPIQVASRLPSLDIARLLLDHDANVNAPFQDGLYNWTALHGAVLADSSEMVQLLLDAGANVDLASAEGIIPLHAAVRRGNIGMIKLLLDENPATSNARNDFGETVIHFAIREGDIEVIELLVGYGAEVSSSIILPLAVTYCDYEIVDYFLKVGADVNRVTELSGHRAGFNIEERHFFGPPFSDRHGFISSLQAATGLFKNDIIELLLKFGANVNKPSALPTSVAVGNSGAMDLLLAANADVNTQNSSSNSYPLSAVQQALLQNDGRTFERLLQNGANWSSTDPLNEILLVNAAEQGNQSLVESLVQSGIDADAPSCDSRPAVRALEAGHFTVARYLLRWAARDCYDISWLFEYRKGHCFLNRRILDNPEAVLLVLDSGVNDDFKDMALQYAVRTGNTPVVQALLSRGADVNASTSSIFDASLSSIFNASPSHTALQWATGSCHRTIEIIRILLDAGANVNAPASQNCGITALKAAAESNDYELVKILIEAKADVNTPAASHDGCTALRYAAGHGNMKMLVLLLQANAAVNGETGRSSALAQAAGCGRLDSVQLLLNAGAETHLPVKVRYQVAIEAAVRSNHKAIARLLRRKRDNDEREVEALEAEHFVDWSYFASPS
ncbi:MAG: hypothetical protein M1814_004791 [Vezdaea aestivalis]|nr:MAG: hypothetical protein M1814_004791 [Vezdaea aestivalis]